MSFQLLKLHAAPDLVDQVYQALLAAISDGDELRTLLVALRRLTKQEPLNTAAIRERLADKVVEAGGYIF